MGIEILNDEKCFAQPSRCIRISKGQPDQIPISEDGLVIHGQLYVIPNPSSHCGSYIEHNRSLAYFQVGESWAEYNVRDNLLE